MSGLLRKRDVVVLVGEDGTTTTSSSSEVNNCCEDDNCSTSSSSSCSSFGDDEDEENMVAKSRPCRSFRKSHRHRSRKVVKRGVALLLLMCCSYVAFWRGEQHGQQANSLALLRSSSSTTIIKTNMLVKRPTTVILLENEEKDPNHSAVTRIYKTPTFYPPPKVSKTTKTKPDYGGLIFKSLANSEKFQREIHPMDEELYKKQHDLLIKEMDEDEDGYYYYYSDEDDEEDEEIDLKKNKNTTTETCRAPGWKFDYYPNCNTFHEVDLSRFYREEYHSHPFSHGAYRDAWLVESSTEDWVLKIARYNHDFGPVVMNYVQRDAVVMEKLSSSNKIIDMYGHCASSLNVESMTKGLMSYLCPRKRKHEGESWGDFFLDVQERQEEASDATKLQLVIEMAESLAELHGYEGGVIVHNDIHVSQWLRAKDGTLKLGDFNRGIIMDYNQETHEYCKFSTRFGVSLRSPEAQIGKICDEKIDVFTMGNILYTVLTRLWPFYATEDRDELQKMILDGQLPHIDKRYREGSYAERRMVEILEQCWAYDPEERADIFQVVEFLRETLKEHLKQEVKKKKNKNKKHQQ